MTRPTTRNWWIFGVGAAALVVAMLWLTKTMLRLDEEKRAATAETEHQIAVSTALWRMDSWLALQLAPETTRPYFEYEAFYPNRNAYTKLLSELQPGEVHTPSSLLTFRSEIFPLHFQIEFNGKVTSPQVPTGNWNDLTQSNFVTQTDLAKKAELLRSFRQRAPRVQLGVMSCFMGEDRSRAMLVPQGGNITQDGLTSRAPAPQTSNRRHKAWQSFDSRRRAVDHQTLTNNSILSPINAQTEAHVLMGPLLPMWLDPAPDAMNGEAEGSLIFVRRVQRSGQALLQGVLTDWPKLKTRLLAEIQDLFPDTTPRLKRFETNSEERSGQMLASVPAKLEASFVVPTGSMDAPTQWILILSWVGLCVTILAVGFALHSTNRFGERRARFASAVTHELRTPLTTFRMYSEMLAEDMVQEAAQRTEYLNTLKHEADRLSRLVENVLSYSRLEEGRYNAHVERLDLADLLARIRPVLEHRTQQADGTLDIAIERDAELRVDVDAVSQILFNLVDNACKYGVGPDPVHVEIDAAHHGDRVAITVRDHGPGVPPTVRGRIFKAFDRGTQKTADNDTPGVGLGLALARALAVDLGGALELLPDTSDGAAFRLTIAVAAQV